MATLHEYFRVDFRNAFTYDFSWETNDSAGTRTPLPVRVGFEQYAMAKFIAYFVPLVPNRFQIARELIQSSEIALKKSNDLLTIPGFVADIQLGRIGSQHAVFSRRIYLYSEQEFTPAEVRELETVANENGLWLTIRSEAYLAKKLQLEKPLAFVSHDTRDKAEVAEPIAAGLSNLMCPVWYDEYSLKVGDRLRSSIERGLREAKKCVLIITPNFLANTGWSRTEFDSVFTREIIEKESVVLPVWYNVTPKQVYDYSPSLADRKALDWGTDHAEVIRRLYRAINT